MEFAAAPIFLLMGFIAYLQPPPLCTAPGEFGFLSSMWFMYGVMSVVHAGPWLSLAWQQVKNGTPSRSGHKQDHVQKPSEP